MYNIHLLAQMTEKDDTISGQKNCGSTQVLLHVVFSIGCHNLETKFNSTRLWQKNMKPHLHGICKDLLIRSHVFSNATNSYQFLLNKTKEKMFCFVSFCLPCFVLFLIGIRVTNVKMEMWQHFHYLWIQSGECIFKFEVKNQNEVWCAHSFCPFQPQEGKIQ